FGKLLEGVFGVGSNMDKNIMGLGYNLGKYIYLVDAYTDYEKDIKQGEYNVFYLKYGKIDNLKDEVTFMLECILTDMIEFYENLQIKRNKKIIDNVLYIGILIEMLKSNKPLRKDK
ncbi:MAG: hypothetical protein IJR47_02840, partial [Clostridia bacterium]|nr:hypothetical protein [Clostridia bacterium]